MTDPIELVAGDIDDSRTVVVDGVEDLAWATAAVARVGVLGSADAVELTATILDATARTVEINFGTAAGWLPSAAVPGLDYLLDVVCSSSTRQHTSPTRREDMIPVIVRARRT